jgi:CIC family chloride channel protein
MFLQLRLLPARMLTWSLQLYERVPGRQFLLMAAVVVGLWAGLSAVLLKIGVHYLQKTLAGLGVEFGLLYLIAPMAGIALTQIFIHTVLDGKLSRGTSHVLLAMAQKSSKLPVKETYAHAVTSALTVGTGGSAGLESPIVQTGAAVGSVFASAFPLSYRDRTMLLSCGAAAGIAAAFNAPIAGVLIAIEVLLVDAGASAFIPLLISGATGALTSHILLSEDVLFSFRNVVPFNYINIPFYVLLGLACAMLALAYKKVLPAMEAFFKRNFRSPGVRVLAGGVLLGALFVLFPALFGEGYAAIRALAEQRPERLFDGSMLGPVLELSPWLVGVAVLVTGLIKPAAVAFTLGAGGNGGNFAPSLLVGSTIGFAFAWFINLTGITTLPIGNFTLVAMAGVMAGIFHAPLSGIFLIAEVTGGYDLIIPLMLVSALSTAVSRYFMPDSLDQAALKARKTDIHLNKDVYVLSDLDISSLIERDFVPVRWHQPLRELISAITRSNRNVFPVVDEHQKLKGLVFLEDVREIMFENNLYDLVNIDEVMVNAAAPIDIEDEVPVVMNKFERTGLWNLPVTKEGRYVGFISKSSMFEAYRSRLKDA